MRFDLVGIDGNAYSVMGYVNRAMRKVGFSKEERDAYHDDATSSDYNHLLCVSIDMIDKCNDILMENGEYDEDDDNYDSIW